MKKNKQKFPKNIQYYKFCLYGFLKNLRFFDPFIFLFFLENNLLLVQIGFLFSVRELIIHFLEIPSGVIADALGRRYTMVVSFVAYIISFNIFYFSTEYYLFLIAMVFFAVGEAFRSGTHKAMIVQYLKLRNLEKYKVEYYGHTRSASQFGSAISSIIAALLVFSLEKYRVVFIASTIPYLFDILLVLSYPKEVDNTNHNVFEGKFISNCYNEIKKTTLMSIKLLKRKSSIRVIFSASIFEAFFKTIKDYLQPIVKKYIVVISAVWAYNTDKMIALIIGGVYFVLFIFTSFASRNASNFRDKVKSITRSIDILYILGVFIILISGVLYQLDLLYVIIALFVIFYMVLNIRKPLCVSYITDISEKEITATILSTQSQLKSLLIIILAPLMGYLSDKLSIGYGLIILSIILLVFYPFARLMDKEPIS